MRKGFTLVEALVTLGIIGTIAAITIPSVVNDVYERETIAKARKIYSVLNQGMHNAINTSDLNFTLYCGQPTAPAFADFQDKFNLDQVFNISNDNYTMTDIGNGVLLKSGEAFFVTLSRDGDNCGTITADINGDDTPNQAGADRFVFNLSCKGEVVPQAGTSHNAIVNGVLPD